ncbi:hypothetical protein HPB50_013329 [Hyalomma asiaticum]|uniref:Uncharacterized protein n=1 Tax=Hyalomma asiaticum TaxID=266040 RepID=A0ACB7RHV3_HYAAI|nr:hypothetical protein HPB50_013329 [Hyalomma asiaticum]
MLLVGECEGDLKKKKDVDLTGMQCDLKWTESALATQGNCFVTLPLEKQLTSVLSSKKVSKALKSSLERISQPHDTALKSDSRWGFIQKAKRGAWPRLNGHNHDDSFGWLSTV